MRHGWELNAPMTALVGKAESGARPAAPIVKVEGAGLVVTALKPADNGKGWILRFYEAHGGHSQARVSFCRPAQARHSHQSGRGK